LYDSFVLARKPLSLRFRHERSVIAPVLIFCTEGWLLEWREVPARKVDGCFGFWSGEADRGFLFLLFHSLIPVGNPCPYDSGKIGQLLYCRGFQVCGVDG